MNVPDYNLTQHETADGGASVTIPGDQYDRFADEILQCWRYIAFWGKDLKALCALYKALRPDEDVTACGD